MFCGRVCLNEKISFKAEHIDYKTGFQTRPAIYRKFYPNKNATKKQENIPQSFHLSTNPFCFQIHLQKELCFLFPCFIFTFYSLLKALLFTNNL